MKDNIDFIQINFIYFRETFFIEKTNDFYCRFKDHTLEFTLTFKQLPKDSERKFNNYLKWGLESPVCWLN